MTTWHQRTHVLDDVAIIGMSCHLPGGTTTLGGLWRHLTDAAFAPHGGDGAPADVLGVVDAALDDAGVDPLTLGGVRVSVTLAGPASCADPVAHRVAARLYQPRGTASVHADALGALHRAHHQVRHGEAHTGLVIAHHPAGGAAAVVVTSAAAARTHRYRAWALLRSLLTRPVRLPDTAVQGLLDLALARAGRGRADLVHLHSTGTGRDDLGGIGAPVHTLDHLGAREPTSGLAAVMASALMLHHTHPVTDSPAAVAAVHESTRESTGLVLLTAPPALLCPAAAPEPWPEVVLISAPTRSDLVATARDWADRAPALGNVSAVANAAKHTAHHRVRAAVAARDLGGLIQALRSVQDDAPNADVIEPHVIPAIPAPVVFAFANAPHTVLAPSTALMRLDAYARGLARARQALAALGVTPGIWQPGTPLTGEDARQATFAHQVALSDLLAWHGVRPDHTLGYGVGRASAAYALGDLSLDQAARALGDTPLDEPRDPVVDDRAVVVEVGPYPMLARHLVDAGIARHASIVTCDPVSVAHTLGELYALGHLHAPTPAPAAVPADTDLARPTDVAETAGGGEALTATRNQTAAFLLRLLRRITHLEVGVGLAVTWGELELTDRQLIRVVGHLRQVPAWAHLTTADLHPDQSLARCAEQLTALLTPVEAIR